MPTSRATIPRELHRMLPGISELCRASKIRRLSLFGSAAQDCFNRFESDFDFVVDYSSTSGPERFWERLELQGRLEELLGRHIDMLDRSTLRRTSLIENINRTQIVLFDDDPLASAGPEPNPRDPTPMDEQLYIHRRTVAALSDVQAAAAYILRRTHGLDQPTYAADEDLQLAVERQFITIGEAFARLRRLSEQTGQDIIQHFTGARGIINFRNVLVHNYDLIEEDQIWLVISKHLPVLIREIDKFLTESAADTPSEDDQ